MHAPVQAVQSCALCITFICIEVTRNKIKCSIQIVIYTAYSTMSYPLGGHVDATFPFRVQNITHSTHTAAQLSNRARSTQEAACASTEKMKEYSNPHNGVSSLAIKNGRQSFQRRTKQHRPTRQNWDTM
jgi:hypothetical protein